MNKSGEHWVRVCEADDAPAEGQLMRVEIGNRQVCVANVEGALRAMDNLCPHRMGPLDEGWIENGEVVCPWHGWCFNPVTGVCSNATGAVSVYPVKVERGAVFVAIENPPEQLVQVENAKVPS
ncbi:MAG TPA: Rieske 2Fe-2S domain-containing protein [Acidobacteriaceae bacterium]